MRSALNASYATCHNGFSAKQSIVLQKHCAAKTLCLQKHCAAKALFCKGVVLQIIVLKIFVLQIIVPQKHWSAKAMLCCKTIVLQKHCSGLSSLFQALYCKALFCKSIVLQSIAALFTLGWRSSRPFWMARICWDTADKIRSSRRLNSSKHPHAPTCITYKYQHN